MAVRFGEKNELIYSLLPLYGYLHKMALNSATLVSLLKIVDLSFLSGHVVWRGLGFGQLDCKPGSFTTQPHCLCLVNIGWPSAIAKHVKEEKSTDGDANLLKPSQLRNISSPNLDSIALKSVFFAKKLEKLTEQSIDQTVLVDSNIHPARGTQDLYKLPRDPWNFFKVR